jgi:dihydrofolate synthase/folylpolyglutamate synthase
MDMPPRPWLDHLEQFGIKLGLARISAIVDELGRPDLRFDVVHVAGTNGKGSVSAMVARALSTAGYRTGLYTSPHLIRLEERFRIDGRAVDSDTLDRALEEVRAAVERLRARGVLEAEPTFFEATTAAGFLVFAASAVRVAVIEVGLGGRFDATNVVTPLATAITSIDFDHQAQLGSTLSAIAGEKAGIIKSGIPVVVGEVPAEAHAVIERTAEPLGARVIGPAGVSTVGEDPGGHAIVQVALEAGPTAPLRLSLAGAHQVTNAGVAARLLEVVARRGLRLETADIASGLTTARWPARLETVVTRRGRAIVDGAHNPAGARALASYLERRHPAGVPVVFGAMRDKALAEMIAPLLRVARPLVCTQAPGARAATADELAAIARASEGREVVLGSNLEVALAEAWARGPEIVVAGSLYLAGAALAHLGVPVD